PHRTRIHSAPGQGLWLSPCLAPECRSRRSQSRRRGGACRFPQGMKPVADPLFEKIALIGVGLIGSSIARVIRREGLARRVSIATRRSETLERARALDLGEEYHLDSAAAVRDADCVVVSVPVGSSADVAREIAGALKPGAILTDVGSTKSSVIEQMAPFLPEGVHFIPGHPIAGTEHSGPDAGFAELFEGRWCILTP